MSKPGEFGEPWKKSKASDAIVSSNPPTQGQYAFDDSAEHYGGDLVAESCRVDNRRRIIACINACEGISTESLERIVADGARLVLP